jgi:hypothetical protein
MSVALAMEGSFGFSIQSAKGTFVAPTTWLPLIKTQGSKGDTVGLKRNYVVLDTADGSDYQTRYFSAGEWVAGELCFPVVPGSVSALFSWIQDRDSEAQAKWASALIDCVHEVKMITDLKVARATLTLTKGEPVVCALEVCGLKLEGGTHPSPTIPVAAPYIFREAKVELAVGGEAMVEDVNCESIRIEVDTVLEDPAAGLRLQESAAPAQLYNLAGVRCTGSFERDFADSSVYADFAAGQEAALQITLERDATSATISLPRVLYTGSDLGLPGTHAQRIVETVDFVALGSVDGATPPVVLS